MTLSSETLLSYYDNLHFSGIVDTYEGGLEFLKSYDTKKNLIIFLGSSFGNFAPDDGIQFLKKINSVMKPGDLILIGLDLVKDSSILELAYNYSEGVTARFNVNVLSRINDYSMGYHYRFKNNGLIVEHRKKNLFKRKSKKVAEQDVDIKRLKKEKRPKN